MHPLINRLHRKPLIPVLLTALMHIAMFPRIEIPWLAFIAYVPIFLLLHDRSPRNILFWFFVSGSLGNLGNLYWIYHVMHNYGHLSPPISVAILLLLCLALGALWGFCGFLLAAYRNRWGLNRALLMAPFLWILQEWSRAIVFDFPWCFVGYSQTYNARIAQLASFTGVYGLSWLLILFNAGLVQWMLLRKHLYITIASVILLTTVVYGHFRIQKPVGYGSVTVGCIQGNIPQDVKHNYDFAEKINEQHVKMTRDLIARSRPDVVLWSEASTLFPLLTGGHWTDDITALAKSTKTPIVIGSDTYTETSVFNSAFYVNANGVIESQYDKIYLVPFGEYVPLKRIFFFAGKAVPEISDFSGGRNYNLFLLKNKKFAVHICFEVVFPQLSRAFTNRGAGLLTTITNDAWFGKTSAPEQHFMMAAMRAVENRRYMVRSANTGISGFVDPYGRPYLRTGIFVPAVIEEKVKWIDELTVYAKFGDILIYFSLAITFITLSGFALKKKQSAATEGDTHGSGIGADI